jgi:hypothetical protein
VRTRIGCVPAPANDGRSNNFDSYATFRVQTTLIRQVVFEETVQRLKHSPFVVGSCLILLGGFEIVALLFAFEQPAHAYVDPGSGFVFLQVAGSMAAGALFYLRHQVKKLLGLNSKTSREPPPAAVRGGTGTPP